MPKRPQRKVPDARQNPNVGGGKKLTNSVLTKAKPRPSRFSNFTRRLRQGAKNTSFVLAGTAIGFFGRDALEFHNQKVAQRRAAIEQKYEALSFVRNPKTWVDVNKLMGWKAENPVDRAKIEHIEKLSKRLGVPVKNVLIALSNCRFSDKGEFEQKRFELNNRINNSKSQAEKDRLERVIYILDITRHQFFAVELDANIFDVKHFVQRVSKIN